MRIRTMRHRVEIQALLGSTAADARGQTQRVFATVETVQAAVEPLGGRELTIAREVSARATHRVTMHHTTTLSPAARLKLGDRILNVESVRDIDQRGRYLEALCAEEVSP